MNILQALDLAHEIQNNQHRFFWRLNFLNGQFYSSDLLMM